MLLLIVKQLSLNCSAAKLCEVIFFKEEEEKEKICISVRISIYLFNDVILASSSYDLQLGLELFASIRISDSKSETLSLCLSVRKKQCPLLVGNELLHGRL